MSSTITMTSKFFDDEKILKEFVEGKGNGVKGLAEQGLTKVPQKYIRPFHERILLIDHPNPTADQLHHPIDLTCLLVDGPDKEQVVGKVLFAAESLGYFQVVNHGVPSELLEAVRGVTHEFFEQPAEKKMVYSTDQRVMYKSSYVNEKEPVWDWRDSLSLAYATDAQAMETWPTHCKEIILEYLKATSKVSKALLEILLGKLGASTDDRNSEGLACSKLVHMNYYPPCPNPELTNGTRCHSDKSLITILLQDGIGGLFVKAANDVQDVKRGEWIGIPPVDGALVINIGDMLQVLSNGRYRSPEHRVRTSKISPRISVAVFTLPVLSAKVGPLPQAIAEANEVAFYKEFVYKDYLINYVSTVHTGKRPLDYAAISNHA